MGKESSNNRSRRRRKKVKFKQLMAVTPTIESWKQEGQEFKIKVLLRHTASRGQPRLHEILSHKGRGEQRKERKEYKQSSSSQGKKGGVCLHAHMYVDVSVSLHLFVFFFFILCALV